MQNHHVSKRRWGVQLKRLLMIFLIAGGSLGSSIKSDESVTFFRGYAFPSPDGKIWNLTIHAWVYELEEGSRTRGLLLKLLSDRLGLKADEASNALFLERARYFIADNERGKFVRVRIAARDYEIGPSEANGYITTTLQIDSETLPKGGDGAMVVEVLVPGRETTFTVPLTRSEGFSVVSDLDDTIKVSEVASRRALLDNTFLKEFRPVPEMSDLYSAWAKEGASFHYVSASPWQLYPAVSSFLDGAGFPKGSLSMKTFRWKDSSFFDLFAKNDAIKRPMIESILKAYPSRKFVLVGDTGELDASLYASLARDYSDQVVRIFIRNSTNEDPNAEKWSEIFRGIRKEKWLIFSRPGELPSRL